MRFLTYLLAGVLVSLALPDPPAAASTPSRLVNRLKGTAVEAERTVVRSIDAPPATARVFGETARGLSGTAVVNPPRPGGVLGRSHATLPTVTAPKSPGRLQLRVGPRFQAKVDPTPRQREFNKIVYPPNSGFLGKPGRKTLLPGTVIDRFGSSRGAYASPVGTPKVQRALPLASGPRPYAAYVIVKPLRVRAGKAAPNFGQPGGGVQYQFIQSMKHMRDDMVEYLKDNGFLRQATPKDRHFLRGNFGAQSR